MEYEQRGLYRGEVRSDVERSGRRKRGPTVETTVGRANGKVQLGGDQDTERSAVPAATLLCLGFIREALHGNAAAE